MPRRVVRALLRLLAVAAIALSCASCAKVIPAPGGAAACSWEDPSQPTQGPAVSTDTVVLVDDSASFWPKAGQQQSLPDDPVTTAVGALLRNFTGAGTRLVSFGTFDGSSTTVDWRISQAPLPEPTGDSSSVTAEQTAAATCLTNTVQSAVAAPPQAPGTDVMAALAAAGDQLQGEPAGSAQVVVLTDGLSNTGCLNLSSVLANGQAASTVLSSCPEQAGLTLLRGVDLQLDGIGYQAAPPLLTTAQQAWVQAYWTDMCTALKVSSAASCVTHAGDDTTRVSTASRLSDPAIQWPTVKPSQSTVAAPADLLFAFNSATLSASGQAYLALLAGELKQAGRTITQVIGYTDAVGSVSYNLGLSRQRAEAVSSYLAAHGFPGVAPVGMGKADPVCSPQYTASGAPIEACMAKDRRVQIILGG